MAFGPQQFGKWLVGLGALIVLLGLLIMLLGRIGLFRLPGDLSFGGRHWRVYLPLAFVAWASRPWVSTGVPPVPWPCDRPAEIGFVFPRPVAGAQFGFVWRNRLRPRPKRVEKKMAERKMGRTEEGFAFRIHLPFPHFPFSYSIGTGRGRHRDRPLQEDAPPRPYVPQKSKRKQKFCPRRDREPPQVGQPPWRGRLALGQNSSSATFGTGNRELHSLIHRHTCPRVRCCGLAMQIAGDM
jgi:hypothetical protein